MYKIVKISVFWMLLSGLTIVPVRAQHYAVDIDPTIGKNFQESVTKSPGEQVTLDIYLRDALQAAHSGGAWLDWSDSTSLISYVSASKAIPPWAAGGVIVDEPAGPGTLMIVVVNLGYVQPDAGGDIIVGKVVLQCEGTGDAQIFIDTVPETGTWGPCPPYCDENIGKAYFTVRQVSPATSSTTTSTAGSSSTTTSSMPITTTIKVTTTTTVPLPPPTTSSIPSTTTSVPALCPVEEIYGKDAAEVQILRFVRDNLLSKTPEGREIIELYYKWSPAISKALREDRAFEKKVQSVIDSFLRMGLKVR